MLYLRTLPQNGPLDNVKPSFVIRICNRNEKRQAIYQYKLFICGDNKSCEPVLHVCNM